MSSYYDMDGLPMELMEWARTFEDRKDDGDWRIGFDEHDGVSVSTVWLGLDHNYSLTGPPLIFETMIFGGEHAEYQERYSTKEEALAGHERAYRLAFEKVLATYTLQLIGNPPWTWTPNETTGFYQTHLRETEENLSDLLPEGYEVRIKEWSDE